MVFVMLDKPICPYSQDGISFTSHLAQNLWGIILTSLKVGPASCYKSDKPANSYTRLRLLSPRHVRSIDFAFTGTI
jgi:hypothetical protein